MFREIVLTKKKKKQKRNWPQKKPDEMFYRTTRSTRAISFDFKFGDRPNEKKKKNTKHKNHDKTRAKSFPYVEYRLRVI